MSERLAARFLGEPAAGKRALLAAALFAMAVALCAQAVAAGSLGVLVASNPVPEDEIPPCVICRYLAQQNVLFDIPSVAAALPDPAGVTPVPGALLAAGLDRAAVFLLQLGPEASFQQAELTVIKEYVQAGGSLVVAPSRAVCNGGSLAAANSLLQAVGATARFGAVSEPGARVIAQVPKVSDGLAGILLACPVAVKTSSKTATSLLLDTAESAAQKSYGALEQVGLGYVVTLGAPVLSQEMPAEYDTLPFMVALLSWLGERSSMCLQ